MTRRPRIVVVGSVNTDLQFLCRTLPRAGETVFGSEFGIGFGGKGANQAVAASLCGAEVTIIAAVGADLFGTEAVGNLTSHGIDTAAVRVISNVATGSALILVEQSGENRIVVVPGANEQLMPADVGAAQDRIAAADMVLVQFEVPLQTVQATVCLAQSHRVPCLVNPAPALPVPLAELAGAEYLILNESEAQLLSRHNGGTDGDLERCLDVLLASGLRRIVLTLGARGAVLASADARTPISPFAVSAIDTTGAGDAFIGSLATFLSEGMTEADAARRASLYAALSATRRGAQQSFLGRAEFEAELRKWAAASNHRTEG